MKIGRCVGCRPLPALAARQSRSGGRLCRATRRHHSVSRPRHCVSPRTLSVLAKIVKIRTRSNLSRPALVAPPQGSCRTANGRERKNARLQVPAAARRCRRMSATFCYVKKRAGTFLQHVFSHFPRLSASRMVLTCNFDVRFYKFLTISQKPDKAASKMRADVTNGRFRAIRRHRRAQIHKLGAIGREKTCRRKICFRPFVGVSFFS